MTIAACYLVPEGIVLGADSTISSPVASGGFHYLNHNQKLFQIGENSTLGVITWGMGSVGNDSYRTLLARFADHLKATAPANVADVAQQWLDRIWAIYSTDPGIQAAVAQCQALAALGPPAAVPPPAAPAAVPAGAARARTDDEEKLLIRLKQALSLGFCVAGYMLQDRNPAAFHMNFDPLQGKPALVPVGMGCYFFWGAPNMIRRLMWGYDELLPEQILNSGKWTGTPDEINALLNANQLGCNNPPIRDAIDFVHTCIFSTIKALKFSSLHQICGGPIELAVLRTDRPFQWVRHKEWDSAIDDGGL